MGWNTARRVDRLHALSEELRIVRAELDAYSDQLRAMSEVDPICDAADIVQISEIMDKLMDRATLLRDELLLLFASHAEDDIEGWTTAA